MTFGNANRGATWTTLQARPCTKCGTDTPHRGGNCLKCGEVQKSLAPGDPLYKVARGKAKTFSGRQRVMASIRAKITRDKREALKRQAEESRKKFENKSNP